MIFFDIENSEQYCLFQIRYEEWLMNNEHFITPLVIWLW